MQNKNLKIGVIGGGSWATALVKLLTEDNNPVSWWMRSESSVEHIKKYGHNPNYISSVLFNRDVLNVTTNIKEVFDNCNCIVLAIPSAFLTKSLGDLTAKDFENKSIFSAIKGIEPESNLIVGDYIQQKYNVPINKIGVICGPCHSEEVALEKLSYLTIACQDEFLANEMANSLKGRFLKTVISDDIYGTEYAAVLKNVMAIATGMAHGLGYGDNFIAVLMSNAIREIKRFVDVVHPIDRDIKDSAYLGDMLVTSYSQFSRNRTLGNYLGKGYSVKYAQLEMSMVAEGYYAVNCVHSINEKFKVNMPITECVYNVCYLGKSPKKQMQKLADKLD